MILQHSISCTCCIYRASLLCNTRYTNSNIDRLHGFDDDAKNEQKIYICIIERTKMSNGILLWLMLGKCAEWAPFTVNPYRQSIENGIFVHPLHTIFVQWGMTMTTLPNDSVSVCRHRHRRCLYESISIYTFAKCTEVQKPDFKNYEQRINEYNTKKHRRTLWHTQKKAPDRQKN